MARRKAVILDRPTIGHVKDSSVTIWVDGPPKALYDLPAGYEVEVIVMFTPPTKKSGQTT